MINNAHLIKGFRQNNNIAVCENTRGMVPLSPTLIPLATSRVALIVSLGLVKIE